MKKVTKRFLALLTTVTMGVAALTACGNNAASEIRYLFHLVSGMKNSVL